MKAPTEIIVEFIKRQPEQIRDSLCASFVMMTGVSLGDFDTSDDFRSAAYGAIDRGSPLAKTYQAASAIGVIDYHYSKPRMSPSVMAAAGEAKDSDALRSVARKMELTNAYSDRARSEWVALRRASLSFEALGAYEVSLWSGQE